MTKEFKTRRDRTRDKDGVKAQRRAARLQKEQRKGGYVTKGRANFANKRTK